RRVVHLTSADAETMIATEDRAECDQILGQAGKGVHQLAARGESLAAFGAPSAAAALGTPFDGRCIPGGCVAPPSNTGGILSRRALPAGRLARLGATPDFHHGLQALSAPPGRDYPVQPVPFTSVHLTDVVWAPRIETNRTEP